MNDFARITFTAVGLFFGIARAKDTCERDGRDTRVCREMRHFRSHLNILEGQIELSSVDFELQEKLATSLDRIIAGAIFRRGNDVHVPALTSLRKEVLKLEGAARARDVSMFSSIPLIKQSCQQCHLPDAGES